MNADKRLKAGVILIVIANLLPLGAVFVAKTNLPAYLKAIIGGLFVFGIPELLMVGAIALMGKDNFERITEKIRGFFRRMKPAGSVSKLRYTVGLVLFIIPAIPPYIMAYAPHLLPDASPSRLYVNICSDAMFLISLFVLGGDFWDKLRALFTWDAKVVFPEKPEKQETQESA